MSILSQLKGQDCLKAELGKDANRRSVRSMIVVTAYYSLIRLYFIKPIRYFFVVPFWNETSVFVE